MYDLCYRDEPKRTTNLVGSEYHDQLRVILLLRSLILKTLLYRQSNSIRNLL